MNDSELIRTAKVFYTPGAKKQGASDSATADDIYPPVAANSTNQLSDDAIGPDTNLDLPEPPTPAEIEVIFNVGNASEAANYGTAVGDGPTTGDIHPLVTANSANQLSDDAIGPDKNLDLPEPPSPTEIALIFNIGNASEAANHACIVSTDVPARASVAQPSVPANNANQVSIDATGPEEDATG